MGRGKSKASGGSAGGGAKAKSTQIKNQFLESAMNSRLKGVQRDAKNGTGNYSFKDAKPVNAKDAMKMTEMRFMEKNGNTLVHGLIGNKHVFIADKSDSKIIEDLKKKKEKVSHSNKAEVTRPEIRTTSTYDRWRKRNKSNFDAWFGKR